MVDPIFKYPSILTVNMEISVVKISKCSPAKTFLAIFISA